MKSKKLITLILTAAISTTATPAFAACIPRESTPANADETVIQITENLIGGILDEVKNGTAEYSIDTCYRDMPTVDMATFTVARKLFIEAGK